MHLSAEIQSNINSTLSPRIVNVTKRTSFSPQKMAKPAIAVLHPASPLIILARNVLFLDSGKVTNAFALLLNLGMDKSAYAQPQEYGTANSVLALLQRFSRTINAFVLNTKYCKVTNVYILRDIV
jgi:hypothetical protein